MSLRIALVGYGRMGKMIEGELEGRGHRVVARIDQEGPAKIADLGKNDVDVAIEFTHPEPAVDHFRILLEAGIPVVTGTTGWLERLPEVESLTWEKNGSFLYGSNFSLGVNVLFKLNELLAKMMDGYPAYEPFVEERHHRHKKDAPSGTALSLANQILGNIERKSRIAGPELTTRAPLAEELSVAWTRAGAIVGEHSVTWTSDTDRITLQHEAFNRRGFALGAVLAAEWLVGKQGFFNFSDIFDFPAPSRK